MLHGPREPLERHSPGAPEPPFLPVIPTANPNILLHVPQPQMVMLVVNAADNPA